MFRFDWLANGGEWCGWASNTNSQASSNAQLLSIFAVEYCLEFSIVDVMNMQSFMNKLNMMSISNINKHHQKDYKFLFLYYVIWWRHHHGTILFKLHVKWRCERIPPMKMFFHTYVSSSCIQNNILHWNRTFSWKTSLI